MVDEVIRCVRDLRDIDLRGYKRTSLARRIVARQGECHLAGIAYLDQLRGSDTECTLLLRKVFINYSEFFRDPEVYRHVERLLPEVLRHRMPRLWSAGCALGQEPYSLAMLLTEHDPQGRAKLFATDIDSEAIAQARRGHFAPRMVTSLPPPYRHHLLSERGGWKISRALRRRVVFAVHDLTRHPPISGIHLLLCRNVLMYFELDLQHRVLTTLVDALAPGGILVLGRAEQPHASLRRGLRRLVPRLPLYRRDDAS